MARLAVRLAHKNGHKSYPQAPALCLARFDELTAIGLDAFTKRWGPYWDVPLDELLPEPVILSLMALFLGSLRRTISSNS